MGLGREEADSSPRFAAWGGQGTGRHSQKSQARPVEKEQAAAGVPCAHSILSGQWPGGPEPPAALNVPHIRHLLLGGAWAQGGEGGFVST